MNCAGWLVQDHDPHFIEQKKRKAFNAAGITVSVNGPDFNPIEQM
jgi:hypothetical protein